MYIESTTRDIRPPAGRANRRTVVIGAGPTGLSAAYHLGKEALLIDQNDRVGGWCRSIEDNGFTFDYAGHIMFSKDEYVHEMYKMLLGDNVHWQNREAWIYSKGVYTRYPFQGALYGLPPEVIQECIVGAIEENEDRNGSDADSHDESRRVVTVATRQPSPLPGDQAAADHHQHEKGPRPPDRGAERQGREHDGRHYAQHDFRLSMRKSFRPCHAVDLAEVPPNRRLRRWYSAMADSSCSRVKSGQ